MAAKMVNVTTIKTNRKCTRLEFRFMHEIHYLLILFYFILKSTKNGTYKLKQSNINFYFLLDHMITKKTSSDTLTAILAIQSMFAGQKHDIPFISIARLADMNVILDFHPIPIRRKCLRLTNIIDSIANFKNGPILKFIRY